MTFHEDSPCLDTLFHDGEMAVYTLDDAAFDRFVKRCETLLGVKNLDGDQYGGGASYSIDGAAAAFNSGESPEVYVAECRDRAKCRREAIRNAVTLAMRYWPNAHLGEVTPAEDLRAAFRMLRAHAKRFGIMVALGELERSAYRYQDM